MVYNRLKESDMNEVFEIILISAALTFTISGGIVLSTLFFIDDHNQDSHSGVSNVLPHENSLKRYEAEYDDMKHSA